MTTRFASCLPAERPLPTTISASRALTDGSAEHASLLPLVSRPWRLRVREASLLIRPVSSHDLEAVAAMHRRCSAQSLLDRYRMGGRGPSVPTMQRLVRRPLAFVACTRDTIVGLAVAGIDAQHTTESAEVGLIIEDAWQGLGIGSELITHLAGGAVVCGYSELVAYTATAIGPAQRLLTEVGTTRVAIDPTHTHLHTRLPESAALGLGAVRERLAS